MKLQREERVRLMHTGIPRSVALELVFSPGMLGYEIHPANGGAALTKERLSIEDFLPVGVTSPLQLEAVLRKAMISVARFINMPELDAYRQQYACELLDLVEPDSERYVPLLRVFANLIDNMIQMLTTDDAQGASELKATAADGGSKTEMLH
ncbi:hypothetical protein [Salinibius halmophilus]|uniref:hypothetical protein n=1 Tax=Salinibius halmophilus TaxID=1853216 RepID=UPI001314C4B4|nr:hypothetical protein [Salinibius halmophilus]